MSLPFLPFLSAPRETTSLSFIVVNLPSSIFTHFHLSLVTFPIADVMASVRSFTTVFHETLEIKAEAEILEAEAGFAAYFDLL
jgi:hypothetical protein